MVPNYIATPTSSVLSPSCGEGLAQTLLAAARSCCRGAWWSLAEPQPGGTWRVLLDPSGHPFCLTLAANWG